MVTLADREVATVALSLAEKPELMLLLASRLCDEGAAVRLFLDSSVMIAGVASAEAASRAVFRLAETHFWRLVTTPDALAETVRNLAEFPPPATATWLRPRNQLVLVDDVLTIDRPAVFPVEKDRPILFGALASADVPLALDRADFRRLLGGRFCGRFYGLEIITPGMWRSREREAGRLDRA